MPTIPVSGGNDMIAVGNTTSQPVTVLGDGSILKGVPYVRLDPTQVVGLLPLLPCDTVECRAICGDGWKNPVFGELIGGSYTTTPTYENDWNPFWIDVSIYNANPSAVTVSMFLEKWFQGEWRPSPFAPDLNSNAFGIYRPIGSIVGHPSYAGYDINWGAVLYSYGAGCYRIKFETTLTTTINNGGTITPIAYKGCLQSPIFDLKQWDCFAAHSTVKYEVWNTGLIGDPRISYKQHDLCGILKYDSIRTYGFIKYPKSPTYQKNNLKWGAPSTGKVEKVSDEQTIRYEYNSKYLPEYIHTRFATFGMMSDRLFGSDYNVNNSDRTIKRIPLVYDSGYEPESIDKEAHRTRMNKLIVQVFFNSGIQSITHSLCCPTR